MSYIHLWNNNNGSIVLLEQGKAKRAPIIDFDVNQAVLNSLTLN